MIKKEENHNRFLIILAVLIIIAIIIIYYVSIGKINLLSEQEKKKKRISWIEKQLGSLKQEIVSKEEIKRNLDKRIKNIFFGTRILLCIGYLSLNFLAYVNWVKPNITYHGVYSFVEARNNELQVLLAYNQFAFIMYLLILFVIVETKKDFYYAFEKIHLLIKNEVYSNHNELEDEIQQIVNEVKKLTEERNKLLGEDEIKPNE